MVGLFIALVVLVVLVGVGIGLLQKSGVLKSVMKKPGADAELDESIPVEDLHKIVKRQYVPYSRDESKVLAQVECICGWSDAVSNTTYAKSRGEQHVNNERDRVKQKRATARKLAENEKGDFAW